MNNDYIMYDADGGPVTVIRCSPDSIAEVCIALGYASCKVRAPFEIVVIPAPE